MLCGTACAETLRVLSGEASLKEGYEAAYPGDTLEIISLDFETYTDGGLDFHLTQGDWDIAYVSTRNYNLAELTRIGWTTDLSQFPELVENAANLYPAIRDAVTVDGQLVAFPRSASGLSMGLKLMGSKQSYSDAHQQQFEQKLTALGFTAADQPTTFEELCALGLRYMALPQETRKGTVFLTVWESQPAYLLRYLLNLYETQYLDTGRCENYDTEIFRAAMSQYEPLASALKADEKIIRNEDGSCYVLMQDSSQMLVNDTTFLRLGEGDALPARMSVAILNPHSEHKEAAVRYLLYANEKAAGGAPELYQTFDRNAMIWQSLDAAIAAQIEEGEEQSVIDGLIAIRDSGNFAEYSYQYTEEDIACYREHAAPYLVFPTTRDVDTHSAQQQYLAEKIDVDGFIAALNEALSTAEP